MIERIGGKKTVCKVKFLKLLQFSSYKMAEKETYLHKKRNGCENGDRCLKLENN